MVAYESPGRRTRDAEVAMDERSTNIGKGEFSVVAFRTVPFPGCSPLL